uniref:F-box domain-containing protein n=1 Tax=Musa acuminata subsp. malaccensis TaxID=214687 RepID=A0A804JI35_MUSAM
MGKTSFAVASLSTETVEAFEASLFPDADKNLICHSLCDEEVVIHTLNGLDTDYKELAAAIRARDSPVSFEDLYDKLTNYEMYLKRANKLTGSTVTAQVSHKSKRKSTRYSPNITQAIIRLSVLPYRAIKDGSFANYVTKSATPLKFAGLVPASLLRHTGLSRSVSAKNKKERKEKGITKYISIDIIESVLMRMNPKDAVRLSTVCKEWKDTTPQCDPTLRKTPWLLNVANSNYFLHSTVDKDMSFTIKIHDILPKKLHNWGCFHGWLVLEHHRFSLYNPFTRVRLDLPRHKHGIMDFRYMSSAPTNPDCVVLVFHINELYIWRPGDKIWTIEKNMNVIDYRSQSDEDNAMAADNPSLGSVQATPVKKKAAWRRRGKERPGVGEGSTTEGE